MKPVISVILPVYNGGDFLKLSIESVLQQDLVDFEFLILDDCSTDGSWNFIERINDPRVTRYRNEKNRGLFYNLNFLVSKSQADLIKLWAQDDIIYPNCLSSVVAMHNKYPNLGFSYTGKEFIDQYGNEKLVNYVDNTPEIISSELHARISFFTGSIAGNIANVCIRREALNKVGPFREDMKISADFDMWVRLAKEHDTCFIREKLTRLRHHSGQLSQKGSLYIYHVKEDIEVFQNLLGYVEPAIHKEGKMLLRKHKFVFYYTLMVKELLHGRFHSAYDFYRELANADNFLKLTLSFIKGKIKKPGLPAFLN